MTDHELLTEIYSELKTNLPSIQKKLDNLETRMEAQETKLEAVETKLDNLETRMEAVETKLDNLETRMEAVETKLDNLETRMEVQETKAEATVSRVDTLESRMEMMQITMNEGFASMNQRFRDLEDYMKNTLEKNIKLLTENHISLVHKLNKAIDFHDNSRVYEIKVDYLVDEVDDLKTRCGKMEELLHLA